MLKLRAALRARCVLWRVSRLLDRIFAVLTVISQYLVTCRGYGVPVFTKMISLYLVTCRGFGVLMFAKMIEDIVSFWKTSSTYVLVTLLLIYQ